MDIHRLISRLDKVRQTGQGKWMARCPSHDDQSPSLSIKEAGNCVLLHCFSGCTVTDICAAIGIGVQELFTNSRTPHQIAPGISPRKLADALETELLILAQCAHQRAQGKTLNSEDAERERLAWQRVDTARRATV